MTGRFSPFLLIAILMILATLTKPAHAGALQEQIGHVVGDAIESAVRDISKRPPSSFEKVTPLTKSVTEGVVVAPKADATKTEDGGLRRAIEHHFRVEAAKKGAEELKKEGARQNRSEDNKSAGD